VVLLLGTVWLAHTSCRAHFYPEGIPFRGRTRCLSPKPSLIPEARHSADRMEELRRIFRGSRSWAAVRSVVSANTKQASSTARETHPSIVGRRLLRGARQNLFVTVASIFGNAGTGAPPATAFVYRLSAASMAAWSMFSHRISPCFLAVRSRKNQRAENLQDHGTWPCAPGASRHRPSNDSGGGAPFRKASPRSRVTPIFFSPQHACQRSHPRRSAPSWGPCAGGRGVYSPAHHRFHLHDAGEDLVHVRHWNPTSSKPLRTRGSHHAGTRRRLQ